ncbi:MAG TPA: PRC-barrel domain-containing protein [Alphaproteobacteria bacterium]|nr:PRC-barrel domain-containing protein [Alphaproteobacteria bacterium]
MATTSQQSTDKPTRETWNLISASKVEDTPVYNGSGDRLGDIHDIMIEKRSGQVAYAVMSFGGFLGIGEKYHPLPWNLLTYDENLGGYVVPMNEEQLRGAPAYTESELENFGTTADYQTRVRDYYGTGLDATRPPGAH